MTFSTAAINCYFEVDSDYSFLALYPHKEHIQDVQELAKMLLEKNPRIKGFVVEQIKRGLHISLVIPVDMKSKFDLRKKG